MDKWLKCGALYCLGEELHEGLTRNPICAGNMLVLSIGYTEAVGAHKAHTICTHIHSTYFRCSSGKQVMDRVDVTHSVLPGE